MTDVEVRADAWLERARELEAAGWLLLDLCGLDRLHLGFDDRFGVVVQLLHRDRKERMSIHVAAAGEPPAIPSVTELWPTANFMEREAFDLFGINFEGHPKLTHILLPDEWEGHPLRKDYGVGKVPVDFIPQPLLQIETPGQSPKAGEAGQELDQFGQSAPDDGESGS